MKKILTLLLASLPLVSFAQMPMGTEMPAMQELPEQTIVAHTDLMVAEYKLSEDQAAQLLELNKRYLGKLEYPVVLPPAAEEAMSEAAGQASAFDFTNMSREDQEKMISMMSDMQDMMARIEENQEEYEAGLQALLDKKQMKAWKKAKKHYLADQRIRMEQEFAANFGDFGDFGGGFGGDFGGGFGGGFGF